jgi:hypothetical protein
MFLVPCALIFFRMLYFYGLELLARNNLNQWLDQEPANRNQILISYLGNKLISNCNLSKPRHLNF